MSRENPVDLLFKRFEIRRCESFKELENYLLCNVAFQIQLYSTINTMQ